MLHYTIDVAILSTYVSTALAVRVPLKTTTSVESESSEIVTIKPKPCNIEMPDPIVTIYPAFGFCISVPGDNETKYSKGVTQNTTEITKNQAFRCPVGKQSFKKNISVKIEKNSKLYPALHKNIEESWFTALEQEFTKPYFENLSQFLESERKKAVILPKEDQVWAWTQPSSVNEIKVVIIGQDPYPRPGQAHGLSFSVPKDVDPPPSLLNIYEELKNDIEGFIKPTHGNLMGWARQGVLLLNSVLTVRCYMSNSHSGKGWENLTNAVIEHLNKNRSGIVFLLWGVYAQRKASIVNQRKHHLLVSAHPSPFSAHRGFFGCKHFSRCNKILLSQGKRPIDWAQLPPE